MAIESNINTYYEEQIDSIAEYVMDRVKEIHEEDPDREIDNLNDIINEEIDTRSIYYVDKAYYLARYYLENGDNRDEDDDRGNIIDWTNVWEMVFNDVYKLVDEQIKEKYGEEAEEE